QSLFGGLAGGLALCEGLLIYFTGEQVADLGRDLAAADFRYWAFDLASPALLKMLQMTTGRVTAEAGAPLRFAPTERTAFFEPLGWKTAEVHSTFETAVGLGRIPEELLAAPPPVIPGVEGEFWSGICLLERG
ncbi:MAG TPA: hypothetical protein VGS58_01820, partial [Candidatus Sulfopaludibacter sp.]|nr:hypothetical protein [Candidatus Sulfopaludibacter sp.]